MKIIPFANQPVVGLDIDAKISKDDIQTIERVVNEKLENFEQLGVYIEFDEIHGITLEGLLEDIKCFLPKIQKFKKKATVGPTSWMTQLGGFISKAIPMVEYQHFAPEDKEAAKNWVADING